MPSLNALGEFKFSLNNIANEKDDVVARNQPFNDLPLPDTEAPPFDFSAQDSSDNLPETDSGIGDFDLSAFYNAIPEENNPPSIDDLFQDVPLSENTSPDDLSQAFDFQPDSSQTEGASLDDLLSDAGLSSDGGAFEPQAETAQSDEDFPLGDLLGDAGLSSDGGAFESQAETAQSDEDFPLDDLLGDTGLSSGGETDADDVSLADDALSGGEQEPPGESAGDGFSVPDELLSGLSDEMEAAPSDSLPRDFETEETQPDVPDEGLDDETPESIDMGGESPDGGVATGDTDFDGSQDSAELPDLDFPTADDESQDNVFDLNEESIDLGGESMDTVGGGESGSFSPDDSLPDIDFPAADEAGADSSAAGEAGFDSGFDSSLPDIDFPAAGEAGFDSGFDSSLPDIDFPAADEAGLASGGASEGTGDSGFGDISSEFETDSIDLGSSPALHDSDVFGDDDFALPGIDEIFEKTKIDTTVQPPPKKGIFRRRKEKAEDVPDAEENIEEISLSQEDLDKLLQTLSTYPMNLRIACEEIIAEQVILPQQLSKLIRLLVNGAYVRETAAHAEQILGKPIVIPRSFEKSTGAAFVAEQASFAYIFVHNFLPVLRLFAVIAVFVASVVYLGYKFVYTPLRAESLYQRGYERIPAGEYQRANELFNEAFVLHRKKKWFYLYAEAFRNQRRYMLAEAKYDELLRYYPRDKKGVLDYARMETYYLMNYDKANRLLQQQLLDYAPNDYDGLLAAGDNFLAWADSDPSRFYDRYEDARFSYARLLEEYGWQAPVVERMMRYFIRIDNLGEVLHLRVWFQNNSKNRLSPESIAELGGYLLDKQLEVVRGVPDPYLESIESVRDMLLQAVREEPTLPEPHYHLARYYKSLGNIYEERLTLENAIRAFNLAETESVRRRLYRVDTYYRYANLLINNREFFPADEQLVRGIELYEDFLSRNLISATPQLGQLYAARGDLEYFVKSGDTAAALRNYRIAERYGYSPPEIQYRMGSAYYHQEDWRNALDYLFRASSELPLNRRLLYALGNVAYQRGDYFAAQGYYSRLLDILENQRIRLPVLLPNDNPQFLELGERLMMARNNAGVVYEALAAQTGNREYRSRAMALYAESARAWDSITRNPETMIRMSLTETPGAPGINLGYLNANNALRPNNEYRPAIFPRIDKDVLEPSHWEELAPFGGLVH